MTPTFWQYLLAGNLRGTKAHEIVESIRGGGLNPVSALLSHPLLTAAERKAVQGADLRAFETFMRQGGQVIERPPYRGGLDHTQYPPVLFGRGDLSGLVGPTIGIVGTRQATSYGQTVARRFASELAAAGVTVISGGALGIDACAHEGALETGKSVAVLPCGADIAYPPAHKELFSRMGLVSPFAVGAKQRDYTFLERNAIIAALSDALLVVEVPAKSGATRTAIAAIEQGKQVYVIPGPITSPSFFGSHALIRDGATLVVHPENILAEYGIESAVAPAPAEIDLTTLGGRILAALEGEPITAEKLSSRVGSEVAEVLTELTILEMEGRVVRAGVGYALSL
ncbi:MAG: DNA-processing protein DprA [Chthonomonas sp.]|nr:DNA-processing protein DprA [Chthonomonas sp.]